MRAAQIKLNHVKPERLTTKTGCCGDADDADDYDDDGGDGGADHDVSFNSESLWFQEEQGIMGDAVPDTALSEERDFLLQVVSLPDREAVEVLHRHPEQAEELRLGEVPLPGRETFGHNRGAQREREVRAEKIMASPTEGQGGRFTSSRVLSTPGGSLLRPLWVTTNTS